MKRLSSQMLASRRKTTFSNLPFELSLESVANEEKFERRQDGERVDQFNEDVKAWSIHTTRRLRLNVRAMVRDDRELSQSITPKLYYDRKHRKEVNRVGFSFAREGIYLEKGASRGYGGTKGSKWLNKYNQQKQTLSQSLFKMGTGNRKAMPWFDPIINQELPQLADLVADYSATLQINATRLFINQ